MTNKRIPRKSRSTEFKVDVVMEGLAGKTTITELCERKGIAISLYYDWRNRFIEAGTVALVRKAPVRRTRRNNSTSANEGVEEQANISAQFAKFRRDRFPFPARMSVSEKLEVIELVGSTNLPKIASLRCIGVPSSTYYGWVCRLRETGTLKSCQKKPGYCRITQREDLKKQVFKVLHSPPSEHGFNRTTWKLTELQEAIARSGHQIGRHSIRQIIKEAGYRWMKARKVLTSTDPDYREKLTAIQETLSGLGPNDGFFSIDEFGPFAVKQRQGKKLVPPGVPFTVPQFQKSKGVLILTAALELTTNQVTHFYSERKNTAEMIKLLELLKGKYQRLERIYLSWDAASWHISKKLLKKIEDENLAASTAGGPIVELAPLPAGAQFLNVIESVFSGMSRAVIHNSNYATKEDAKAAIDRYLLERNEYFQKNPKRAGDKIWGKERAVVKFSESNNCKDPSYR